MTPDIRAGRRGRAVAQPGVQPDRATRAPAFSLTMSVGVQTLLLFAVTALLLLVADVILLWAHPGTYHVTIGNFRDKYFLDDANYFEVAPDGKTYRWTRGRSTIWITQAGQAGEALLSLELGGRPEPADVRLMLNDRAWTGFTADTRPRAYRFLLPPNLPDQLQIGILSPTFTVANDPRELGVKIEGFALTLVRRGLPLPTAGQYGAQLALVLAAQVTVLRLGWRWRRQALLALPLALGLALVLSSQLLLVYAYLPRLAIAGGALAALTWLVLPLAEDRLTWLGDRREIRLLWSITLAACAIRLGGVLYTTFASQDTGLNLDRLVRLIGGQVIFIKSSFEFADGQTIHPPGVYLALLPGATLITDLGALMHGFTAILDGTTCFLIAMLTRRLGGNRTAARLAAALYLGSYAAYAILAYGFQKHIFGQWFTTPLALLLLSAGQPPRLRDWLLTTVVLLLSVFAHIGVALLNFVWFACIGLLLLLAYRGLSRSWWWGAGCVVAAALLALGLLYVDAVGIMLSHAANTVLEQGERTFLPGATGALVKGLRLGYTDFGVALLPFGLLMVALAQPGLKQLIVPVSMILTVLLFLVVDLVWAVQTRYFFFALPLAFAAVAAVLGRLAVRCRLAQYAVWALVLAITVQNTLLWFSATFGDGKISMTPLTH